jgi:hypothetical protein
VVSGSFIALAYWSNISNDPMPLVTVVTPGLASSFFK